jgi:ATPase family associated with various cellular activities (AAA)
MSLSVSCDIRAPSLSLGRRKTAAIGRATLRRVDEKRVDDFKETFAAFVRSALDAEPSRDPPFRTLLEEHLGADPASLAVVGEDVPLWDHANLQLGLEALLAEPGRSHRLVGIGGGNKRFMALSLSDLLNERHFHPSSVEYQNLAVGPGRSHPCILYGLVLVRDGDGAAALLVRRSEEHGPRPGIAVEAMAGTDAAGVALLDELRRHMRDRNVFRGQMVSLEQTMWGRVEVAFHERPDVERGDLVLPDGLVEALDRQVVGIGRRGAELTAAGRHLKRGVLLHGPPGTGKTLIVKWLAGELRETTVVVLSGGGLGVAGPVFRLAREVAPSLVVLEDVDLVGEERTMLHGGGPVLFELLNELDGMADDADVAVVLTTNRPDLLEPALAARPGRVDLALEVPLPDESCRRRLFELYGRGLSLAVRDDDTIVARTSGVTASFFKELLRQAALAAVERTSDTVEDGDVSAALDRLLDGSGRLTRILLGAEPREAAGQEAVGPRAWMEAQAVQATRIVE